MFHFLQKYSVTCVCVWRGGGGGGGGEGVRGMSNMGNLTGTVSRLDDDHKAHDI